MMQEDTSVQGRLTIAKYTRLGELVECSSAHNDITLDGRHLVAGLFDGDPNVGRVTKVCLGTSDGAFDENGKSLGAKVFEKKFTAPIDASEVIDSATGRKRVQLRIYIDLAETEGNAVLKEAGLFTDADVMYNRVTFGAITKTDNFKLTLVWEITF